VIQDLLSLTTFTPTAQITNSYYCFGIKRYANGIGIGISFYPNIVPHSVTIWDAAAPDNSLSFLLVGAVVP
jgi:cytochrome bd-type quinol oxidase subunit 2